tara:strand:- start:494 stop:1255 length:762 start_codon:yes stop_codon:yes gene_type:complete
MTNRSKKSHIKKKSHKKNKSHKNIPKIIHQVFFDVGLGQLKDKPLYLKSIANMKQFNAKKDGWRHILWTKNKSIKMIKKYFPQYYDYYLKLPSEWYRLELVRYFALAKYGGFYIDLDMFCNKSLTPLCKLDYFVHTHSGRKWKGGGQGLFAENNCFAFKPGRLNDILKYSQEQFYDKVKIAVYKTWKIRLMLQTVGVKMYARWCKESGIKPLTHMVCTDSITTKNKQDSNKYREQCYFFDVASKAWLDSKLKL